jgi:hypothetical protein
MLAVGGGGCLLRTAAVLTGAQIGRVPVPPVVLESAFSRRGRGAPPSRGGALQGLRRPWLVLVRLPFAAGKPRLDLLEQPAVPVRILERGKREVGTTLRVAPADAWALHGVVEGPPA